MILKRFILRHRMLVASAVALSAASALSTMALLSHINAMATHGVHAGDPAPLWKGAGWLVAVLATGAASQFILARLGGDLVAQLRIDLSRRFIDLEYETLANDKHTIFGSLIEDVASIAPLVLVAPLLSYNVLLVVLYVSYLASVSPPLLAILAGFLSVTVVASMALERFLRRRFDALRDANEKVFEYFRYLSEGKKELALNAARAKHVADELIRPAIGRSRRLMVQVHTGLGFNEAWTSTVIYASVFVIVYIGYASLALPQTTIMRFVIGALFLSGPVAFIVSAARQVGVGTASLRHLQRVGLDLDGDGSSSRSDVQGQGGAWQRIALRGVTYAYAGDEDGRVALGPIDLDIQRGELLFIVGGNGSGKSTLLLLLASLLTPRTGELLVDDVPLGRDTQPHRQRFTGVFGDFFLFPHVLDASGRPLSDERIRTLLTSLGLGSLVQVEQGELSKLTLSTGQRKRLALLQCYAEDRDIFFFDEWAADQDTHFRDYFYRTLLPDLKAQGKTVVAITHDDRYFALADRVVKLESGRVVSDTRRRDPGVAYAAGDPSADHRVG
ncbi:cyclic peptide export ABC transporter [Luteibacter sp. UNCMF366Tsu5.1]|uniref:cyclic peptide export ABC transporter n=1 Tax=Luteibacter sp. UNCMF366Tsu5.1 TaxID=1502758 RepID=UPI00090891E2|nr:cyclic peptide export ABC transporter [Luteibacter sp. UNCMF366Tsu5.1]SFW24911.1 putative ATP-binding cassette transporter [Luteibacter sp. UNCMF366Tsu5.1]